jgi:predicted phosphodiesterase
VALQKKRQSLFQQFEILKWKDTQADADKWRHLDQSVMKPLVETIERYVPDYRPPLLPMPKSIRDPFAIVMNVMDLHFAKHAWTDIAGQTYSKAQCEDLLIRHTSDLIVKLAPYGRPDVIYIPVGSDWNHVDTLNGETTHGTPQDMDGLPENMEFEGKMLAVKHIDLCRQIAPVILVFCPGNHDEKNSLSLLHFLFAWYKDAPDVEVRIATQPRQYVSYGDNLFGFVHGNDEKVTQLASLMASEARTQWGQTKNSFWFTGHLHHEVVRELDGITTYQVNSLSPADRWHAKKGFVLSRRALHAYLIDRHDGVVGQFTSVVKSNDLERPVGTFGFKMSTQARLGAAA